MNADGRGGLEGRSVLVVRVGSSLGRAAVERFAADGALVHAHEGEAIDADERRTATSRAVGAAGALDVLVVPPPDAVAEPILGAADAFGAADAALRTTFFLVQEALRAMANGGRVCIAAPMRPDHLPPQPSAPATLVEGGLIALVRLIAVELAPRRVAVNAVCPIATGADPRTVAAALAFLASDDASYLSGAFVPVMGTATIGARHWDARPNGKE